MRARVLSLLVNAFVLAYALDAGLSLADDILRALTGSSPLVGARISTAGLVAFWSLLWLPLLWITPRLPLGVLSVLIGSVLWIRTGATPLVAFASLEALSLVLSALQLAVATSVLVWIRWRSGEGRWLFESACFEGPFFSLRYSALFSVAIFFVFIPVSIVYAALTLVTWAERGTNGFVTVDFVGISLDDRRYVRDDREIRLVGMMHIGEGEVYRDIVMSFATESTVVLEEGVSDDDSLLEVGLAYEAVAAALGLDQQASLRSYLLNSDGSLPAWPVLRHADVDMSEFSPVTVEWLGWVAALWKGAEPLEVIQRIVDRSAENQEELAVVEGDILDLRNQHLLAEIDRALPDYERVIVPWGALHMPFIESSIIARGFDESHREKRRLVSWITIGAALF